MGLGLREEREGLLVRSEKCFLFTLVLLLVADPGVSMGEAGFGFGSGGRKSFVYGEGRERELNKKEVG